MTSLQYIKSLEICIWSHAVLPSKGETVALKKVALRNLVPFPELVENLQYLFTMLL